MLRTAFLSGRKSLLILVLAAVLLCGAWWWQCPPPDPVYQGRRLSEYFALELSPEQLEKFGPAGITWLTYKLEHGRYPFVKQGPLPFDQAPVWLRRRIPETWGGLRDVPQGDERKNAALYLTMLGPQAAPAIPSLVRLLEKGDGEAVYAAAFALHAIGPASWPTVEDLMGHGTKAIRMLITNTLHYRVGTSNHPATEAEVQKTVTVLVKACHDPDRMIRYMAIDAIGVAQRRRPELTGLDSTIPELTQLLSDRDPYLWGPTAGALASFGPKASPIVPRLIELLDETEPSERLWFIRALAIVDAEEKRSATRLRAMLQDPDEKCREAAAKALTALGFPSTEGSIGSDH